MNSQWPQCVCVCSKKCLVSCTCVHDCMLMFVCDSFSMCPVESLSGNISGPPRYGGLCPPTTLPANGCCPHPSVCWWCSVLGAQVCTCLTPSDCLAGPGDRGTGGTPWGGGVPSGLGPLWHSWLPARPAGLPLHPCVASALWLRGGPRLGLSSALSRRVKRLSLSVVLLGL